MIGLTIDGYSIEELKGRGAFGTVYRCRKDSIDYAIKIFSSQYVHQEYLTNASHNRITQEIEALKRVAHKNIVKIYAFGEFGHLDINYFYIIMEYIDGRTLKEIIDDKKELSQDLCKSVAIQLITGISHLHEKNIIHRDLKPENILLTKNMCIKIVDFGLSKLIDFSSITATGVRVGSPLYMSPEQVNDSKNIDYRSDYYAYGVILFELLTRKTPYGQITSRPELFYKIINEKPHSILQYAPGLPNNLDNLINQLLNKKNYLRPNTPIEIINAIKNWENYPNREAKQFDPTFFLRLLDEKTVLNEFYHDANKLDYCIFPINLQQRQKRLLKFIQERNISFIIDPSTMRLAYDTFSDVKGLAELPYAPKGYSKLELSDFKDSVAKKRYVNLVLNEQIKYKPTALVSPFHFSNNSTSMTIKSENNENWFSLDVKLLKEAKSFIDNENINLPLIGGFAIHSNILTSRKEQEYFLNTLSGLPCDYYLIYTEGINYSSNSSQLYHYIKTLYLLQKSTNKPVIAGRVNTFGLVLLAFGIFGFESGSARFESFSEDLYKEKKEPYNMFVMYYIPELLKNVAIKRKDPSKIFDIIKNKAGIDMSCHGMYCEGKSADELLVADRETKKHFLFRRQEEIRLLKSLEIPDRITYIEKRITNALDIYKSIEPVFKKNDYSFLNTWKKVIKDLRIELNL